MTFDFEMISNTIGNIGKLIPSVLLVCIAWKAHQWSRKIHHGSPIEGRCYYNFKAQDGTIRECNLPCTIIPDIDIDKSTKTVKRARVFRESHTWFNFQRTLYDPKYIENFGDSIWVYYDMPQQTVSMFLHWETITRFEVWHNNKWQTLTPYQYEKKT